MLLRIFCLLALLGAPLQAPAQTYPAKPITIVNGFPPGGGPDILARQLAAVLAKRMNQNVVVDNRPGATGTIGAASVARAEPDGYTLLFGVAANLVIGPATLDAGLAGNLCTTFLRSAVADNWTLVPFTE